MALGAALGSHPDELRADLQREYGLNVDEMGRSFSCLHAASCMAHMVGPSSLRHALENEANDPMRGMSAARIESVARDLGVRR